MIEWSENQQQQKNEFPIVSILKRASISFDLVVCQSSPNKLPNSTDRIEGIPIIYPDRYGRSLARISVYYFPGRILYKIEYIRLFKAIPPDINTDEMIKNIMAN
ncbi:MAG: hypothetical protein ACTSWX_07960 [Promethearchaeota archaeon]